MSLLIVIALAFLVLAAALFFGPYLVTYGPSGLGDLISRGDARFISLFLVAALAFAVFAPGTDPALISSGETVHLVPADMTGPVAA